MGVWIFMENEEDFFLLRSTLQRSMDKRAGQLPEDIQSMYEHVLQAMKTATKDVPDTRPLQTEIGTVNPKPKKTRKERTPPGDITPIVHCTVHKTYKALYRPRTDCEACWARYEKLHGKNPTGKAAVSRKKGT